MNLDIENYPPAVSLTYNGASMRQIHPRSSVSNRGFVIVPMPGQPRLRKRIRFESRLEQKVIYLLLARPDVFDIVEQKRILLPRGNGHTPHTLDLLAYQQDGPRIGVLVKPWKYAQRQSVKDQIVALRNHAVPDHADRFIVVTEPDFTTVQVRNAELLHLARMSSDAEADAVATTPTARSRIERMFLTISLKPLPLPLANKGALGSGARPDPRRTSLFRPDHPKPGHLGRAFHFYQTVNARMVPESAVNLRKLQMANAERLVIRAKELHRQHNEIY